MFASLFKKGTAIQDHCNDQGRKSHVARAKKKKRKCNERRSLKGRLKRNLAGHTIDPRTHWMKRLKTNLAGHMIIQVHSRGCSLLLIIMLSDRTVAFTSQTSINFSHDREHSFQVPLKRRRHASLRWLGERLKHKLAHHTVDPDAFLHEGVLAF